MSTRLVLKILLLSMLFACAAIQALAKMDSPVCKATSEKTELCQIIVKVKDQDRPYYYEIKRAQDGYATVVAIPGGPGQGLIGQLKLVEYSDHISDKMGIILIDPRGFGLNALGPDLDGSIYSSELIASDILNVIKAESLKQYFIHGQSYGTVLATILTWQIEHEDNLPKPQGLILSGVAAHAYSDILIGYNNQLQRLQKQFTEQARESLKKNMRVLLEKFGRNGRTFALLWISLLAKNSEDPSADGINNINMSIFLKDLSQGNWNSKNQALVFFLRVAGTQKAESTLTSLRRNDMPEVIKCRELTHQDGLWDLHFDIEQFKLVSAINDCEVKGYTLQNPYDSRRYQVKSTPLIYVQGLIDPATPWVDAFWHFKNQKNANKVFVLLQSEAHNGLAGLWRCRAGFWDHLTLGTKEFQEFIQNCNGDRQSFMN